MSKEVYVVTGSEDGMIGIYSNKKAAYEAAADYTRSGWGYEEGCNLSLTYAQLCKDSKGKGYTLAYVEIQGKQSPYSTISSEFLKSKF
jgi:hypothetical protein